MRTKLKGRGDGQNHAIPSPGSAKSCPGLCMAFHGLVGGGGGRSAVTTSCVLIHAFSIPPNPRPSGPKGLRKSDLSDPHDADPRGRPDVSAPPSAPPSLTATNSLTPRPPPPPSSSSKSSVSRSLPQTHLHCPPQGKPQGSKSSPLQPGASPAQPPHQAQGPGG